MRLNLSLVVVDTQSLAGSINKVAQSIIAENVVHTSRCRVLVQFERIGNYYSITEPRSGSDRIRSAPLKLRKPDFVVG